jgi:ABC-type glutathione transport system ATPase component
MDVFALYGPSGTGKSTNALELAHKYKINAIIDDGLLIYNGRKVAGTSAKYERTTVQAVKRAIFFYEDHAAEIKQAIRDFSIERILLLGTSQKMVNRIADALEIAPLLRISQLKTFAPQAKSRPHFIPGVHPVSMLSRSHIFRLNRISSAASLHKGRKSFLPKKKLSAKQPSFSLISGEEECT